MWDDSMISGLAEPEREPCTVGLRFDGMITTATLKRGGRGVKTAEARCNPKDTYSRAEGARVAVERLLRRSARRTSQRRNPNDPQRNNPASHHGGDEPPVAPGNEHLRESLLMERKASKAFDDENVELFDVVHKTTTGGERYGKQKHARGCPVGADAGEPEAVQYQGMRFRVCPYAGLNLVLFWWQQAGLLADKAAVPAMWVCAILMGAGIGRCIRGR